MGLIHGKSGLRPGSGLQLVLGGVSGAFPSSEGSGHMSDLDTQGLGAGSHDNCEEDRKGGL